jgi:hypothetical protein
MPRIRQREAAGVTQHVGMHQPGTLAYAFDKAINGVRPKWSAALGGEHIAAVGELPPQLAQRPYLITPQWVNRRFPILGSTHMQGSWSTELDLRPFEIAESAENVITNACSATRSLVRSIFEFAYYLEHWRPSAATYRTLHTTH